MLGRFDMVEQDPYVSRAQCLVQVSADGTASVTSIGKAATFIIKASGDRGWRSSVILRKNQQHLLQDGERIALKKNQVSGAMLGVFTVYAGHSHGFEQPNHDAMQQQQQQQQQHGGTLKLNGWVAEIDEATGRPYYYNRQTGVAQWEPPL